MRYKYHEMKKYRCPPQIVDYATGQRYDFEPSEIERLLNEKEDERLRLNKLVEQLIKMIR